MDDLSAALSRIMSDPESMRQLQAAAASLGLSGGEQSESQPSPPRPAQQGRPLNRTVPGRRGAGRAAPSPPAQGGEELAEIKGLLEQLVRHQQPPQPSPPASPSQGNVPDIDLSALRGILSGLTGRPPDPPPQQTSPDLSALLSSLSGSGQPQPSPQSSGGLDLSALSGILGNLSGGQAQPQAQASHSAPDLSALLGNLGGGGQQQNTQSPASGPDRSALSGILENLGGGQTPAPSSPDLASVLGNLDLSALSGALSGLAGGSGGGSGGQSSTASTLAAMLGGGNDPGPMPGGMDMGMLLKFQQAMSGMSANAGNVKLLMAVKGHLKDEARRDKVDDAIRVMQVVQFLPLLKESGLFGKLEEILDGFGMGGLGNMLGGLGSGGSSGGLGGLGSLLGGLTGRR